jgi:hypothetical protein
VSTAQCWHATKAWRATILNAAVRAVSPRPGNGVQEAGMALAQRAVCALLIAAGPVLLPASAEASV